MLRPPPKPPVEIEAEVIVPSVWRGWGWPQHITVKWMDDGVSYTVKGVMTDEGPVLAEVHMTGVISTKHLRGPFMSVMRNAFAKAALGPERPAGGGYSRKSGTKIRVPVGVGRPVDSTSARQRLDEVARVWKATKRGKGRAVAEHFHISEGYAHILITEARKKGFLDDAD